MSCIIKAVLSNPNIPENGVATVPFPLSGNEYRHSISEVLAPMGIGSAVVQDCLVEEINSDYDILQSLTHQILNVDELDYLAKRLDSFCESELEKFQAACSAFGIRDIKDFINMTFCCQKTTVISDFSQLDIAGRQHFLTTQNRAVSEEEFEQVDGNRIAKQLIQSGKGTPTPYGLFFQNDMEIEELYQGHSFPAFAWDESQGELEFIKPDDTKALIILPRTELELRRFLQREEILDIRNCKRYLTLYHRDEVPIELQGDMAELLQWNKLCGELNDMTQYYLEAFLAALEVIGAEDLNQMLLLASSLDDFEFFSGITDAESYGKFMIKESGQYRYDASLDCYYNYEAFGEFLMMHEVGQVTKYGYLKCEEDSFFLDFFTQEQQTHSSEQSTADAGSVMQMGGMS